MRESKPCYALTACLCLAMAAVMLSACSEPEPVQINLAALREYQGELDGRRVVVSGTVRGFDDPRHYWLENDDLDRVALEGADGLADRLGQTVEVRGVFLYDSDAGRRIEVDQLRSVP